MKEQYKRQRRDKELIQFEVMAYAFMFMTAILLMIVFYLITRKPYDINKDGRVDIQDLIIISSSSDFEE